MPTRNRTARFGWSLALFLGVLLYASWVTAQCGCVGCCSHGYCFGESTVSLGDGQASETDAEVPFAEFRVAGRHTFSSVDGFNSLRGDPINLTWGIVDDGTQISANGNSQPSDLVAFLDGLYGSGGVAGVTNAPWFRLFEASFDRWSELSGVSFSYEPNDFGAPIDATASPIGVTNFYADHRIGGRSIDGQTGPNTLAFNYFPNHADMVIDTDNSGFFNSRFADSLRLRNTIMHEIGHGLGFSHLESSDSGQLMEPFIQIAFDGPQIDDILAAQRNYGDPLEKNGGNDQFGTATSAGSFAPGDAWAIGTDGDSTVVSPSQTDFVSIDGVTDTDFFSFSVSVPSKVDLVLTQVGRAYDEGPQGGNQSLLDTAVLNDLALDLLIFDGGNLTTLASGTDQSVEPGEEILGFDLEPGTEYYARVRGAQDNVQLYELGLGFSIIPEPSTALLGLAGLLGLPKRRAA